MRVYVVYAHKDLELQDLVNVAVQTKEGGISAEILPDG